MSIDTVPSIFLLVQGTTPNLKSPLNILSFIVQIFSGLYGPLTHVAIIEQKNLFDELKKWFDRV